MLAFSRTYIRKLSWLGWLGWLSWLALTLAVFWRWDPAVHPLAAVEPMPVLGARVELDARQILDRMLAVYSSARSYRDTGVVRITWRGTDGFTTQRPFETAFVRGGGFRFESVDQKERSLRRMMWPSDRREVVWGDNATARTWSTAGDGKVENGTLALAISGASGVSFGSARSVPRLLLPETVEGSRVDEIDGAIIAGVDSFRGHECYRLTGKWRDEDQELWIDRESSLLRRSRRVSNDDGETIEQITAYDPVINVDIPDEVFRFEPPK